MPTQTRQGRQPRYPNQKRLLISAALNLMTATLYLQIELHRDRMCRRNEEFGVESVADGERFIDDVGVVNALTDSLLWCERLNLPRRHISRT